MSSPQIILITGANTGLGYQIVLALLSSSEKYTILLGGRSFTKAEAAVISATEEFPSSISKVAPIQIDIEEDESIKRAFNEVKAKYGRLDGLVNNAGIFPSSSSSYEFRGGGLEQVLTRFQEHNSTKNSPQATSRCEKCGTNPTI